MNVEFVPLLQIQRELYEIPRGPGRFHEYLRVLMNDDRDDLRLPPLGAMNPMGRDHLPALLDALLAIDADGVAALAVAETSARLADVPGDFKIGLALADDVRGGWTNRYDVEFSHRFEGRAIRKRGWLTAILWASEAPSPEGVREAVATALWREAHVAGNEPPRTLRERLDQEGRVMALAGCRGPTLDPDDLAYTAEVIAPHLGSQDRRTSIECLFGDVAARSLGFTPRGLSPWAGIAWALHEARAHAASGRS